MSDYNEQTAFLRRMLSHHESSESKAIEERIARVELDRASLLKAAWMVGLFAALSAFLSQVEFFQADPGIRLHVVCVLALAALICLVTFVGALLVYRAILNGLREDCRRLIGESLG